MTRDEAIAQGSKTYMGHPCNRGHEGKRYVRDRHCYACKNGGNRDRRHPPSHHNPRPGPQHRIAAKAKRELPSPHVISSDWIRPPTKAQLMSRR